MVKCNRHIDSNDKEWCWKCDELTQLERIQTQKELQKINNYNMTSEQFVIWLKGFVEASHHWNLTPAAWDKVKDELKKVDTDKK